MVTLSQNPLFVQICYFAGNWSPGDFPNGTSWQPHKKSDHSVNRDLQIVMEHAGLAAYFTRVYDADWHMGEEWKPDHMELTYG